MSHKTTLDLNQHHDALMAVLRVLIGEPNFSKDALDQLVRAQAKRDGTKVFSRDELIRAYREFASSGDLPPVDPAVLQRLRMKPIRTSSGVTPVTVLTKPFPCPGECIFCPNDVRMPKSYLSDEPGAQRAEQNSFDPYLQTMSRLTAYYNTGHPTDKIEVIILGGTWSFYPETYQIWFVKRIFDALHDFGAGLNRSAEVEAALRSGSQLSPERNTTNVKIAGEFDGAELQSGRPDGLPRGDAPLARTQRTGDGRRIGRRLTSTPPGTNSKPPTVSTRTRPAAASAW